MNIRKFMTMLLMGFIMIAFAISISSSYKNNTILLRNNMYISVAGEGFEHVSNPDIIVQFDDDGNVILKFASKSNDEILWINIKDYYPFDWEIFGKIENFDSNGNKTSLTKGKDECATFFRVMINSSETIKLKCSHPVDTAYHHISIHSPLINAIPVNRESIISILDYVDTINEEITEKEYSEDITENLAEYIAGTAQIGRIGDYVLSPSIPHISVTYWDTKLYMYSYSLRAKPSGYEKTASGLSWEGLQQVYPIIEYKKERVIILLSHIVDLLYLIGFFLISTALMEACIWLLEKKIDK